MISRFRLKLVATAWLLSMGAGASHATTAYLATQLQAPNERVFDIHGYAISNAGVAGYGFAFPDQGTPGNIGIVWRDIQAPGVAVPQLGPFLGISPFNYAYNINDVGQVVGRSTVLNEVHGFVMQTDGQVQDLGTLPSSNGFNFSPGGFVSSSASSNAQSLNNLGVVVGESSSSNGQSRAFVWQPGTAMQNLGVLPGDTFSVGTDINDQNVVAGTSGNATTRHAFTWQAGTGLQGLGDLAGGADFSVAAGINNQGQVVGYSNAADGDRAFLWTAASGMQNLGTLAGFDTFFASGINNFGQVVGNSRRSNGAAASAFVWTEAEGMADLNTLLALSDPALAGDFKIEYAAGINDLGQILVGGKLKGQAAAMVMTPVPEPATAGLMALGLLALLGASFRRGSTH